MKRFSIVLFTAAILLAGCSDKRTEEDGPERGMIWDFITPSIAMRVENAARENLLDPSTEGNWLEREIYAEFRGERFPMRDLTRETMPRELMLRVEYVRSSWESPGREAWLTFGEFSVYDTMVREPLTIHWGDGTSDELLISLRLSWQGHDPVIEEALWLNGIPVDGTDDLIFIKQ